MNPNSKILIGRERELTELEGGLDEAALGTGGLFAIAGEPGIGKTRLADETARNAKSRGFTIHWGRCWEAGGAPAFWPWIQVFRSMLRDKQCSAVATAYVDVLARLLPELRKESERGGTELDHAQARFQLFDELWSLLRAVAETTPVLLVVDDLHAADPSSLALLQFIVRDLRSNRVVVLVTYRNREAKPAADVSDAIRTVTREGAFLPLRRLGTEEVGRLLEARSGKTVSRDMASALHRATEGNPMFLDQAYRLLEAGAGLETPPTALPMPDGLRDMIRDRLGALDEGTRGLLEAAAVVGREFTRPLLAAVYGRSEPELKAPLALALESGIVVEPALGAYEFAHALFREALYRDLVADERARLHARAADCLEGSNAPEKGLGEIAQHLLAAASLVGAARAAEGAMRAARRALDVLAFEDAATILTDTLDRLGRILEEDQVHCRVLVMLGEARARTHEHEAARKACEEAASIARRLGDPVLVAEAALALGVELLPGVITSALVVLLEEANRTLPPERSPLRARVLARLAAALQPAPNPEVPMDYAREAVAMARALGDDAALRTCLHMGGSALVDFAQPQERCVWDRELLAMSTRSNDVIGSLRAYVRLFFDHLELGEGFLADAQMVQHEKLSDAVGVPSYQWLTSMMRALRAIWEGRFADAIDLREQARRIGARVMTPDMEMTTLLQGWGLELARGELLEGMQRVEVLGARFAGHEIMTIVVRASELGRRGDLDGARAVLGQIPETSGILSCAGPHLRFLTEAITRVGDRARASKVYGAIAPYEDRMMSYGRVGMFVEGPTSWLLGMLAGTLERWDDANRLFEKSLKEATRAGMKPYEAICALEYARMIVRRGEGPARLQEDLVRRASAIAKEHGQTGVLRELAALGGATPPPSIESASAAPSTPPADESFSLRRDGELWAIQSAQSSFHVKDSRGIQMLSELVLHPNREFHVLTLAGSEGSDAGDAGEVIDRDAMQAYRDRALELREELAEAEGFGDTARAERLRAELDMLSEELAAGVGLGGRSRRAGAAAERAGVNVQRRLREAIRRIGEQAPKLGRHLDRAVRTGTFCAYEPE